MWICWRSLRVAAGGMGQPVAVLQAGSRELCRTHRCVSVALQDVAKGAEQQYLAGRSQQQLARCYQLSLEMQELTAAALQGSAGCLVGGRGWVDCPIAQNWAWPVAEQALEVCLAQLQGARGCWLARLDLKSLLLEVLQSAPAVLPQQAVTSRPLQQTLPALMGWE